MRIDVTACIEDEPGGSTIQVTETDEFAMDADGLEEMAVRAARRTLSAIEA